MRRMRIKASYFWALLIASVVVVWMLSDNILESDVKSNPAQKSGSANDTTDIAEIQAITVNAIRVKNNITPLTIRASGVTETLFENNAQLNVHIN